MSFLLLFSSFLILLCCCFSSFTVLSFCSALFHFLFLFPISTLSLLFFPVPLCLAASLLLEFQLFYFIPSPVPLCIPQLFYNYVSLAICFYLVVSHKIFISSSRFALSSCLLPSFSSFCTSPYLFFNLSPVCCLVQLLVVLVTTVYHSPILALILFTLILSFVFLTLFLLISRLHFLYCSLYSLPILPLPRFYLTCHVLF